MPRIIDYQIVLETMRERGLRCLYHNSGAFGFAAGVATKSVGWIGLMDESIRHEARAMARQIRMPYANNLTKLAERVWREFLRGSLWMMPKSHWAYELDFGNRDWLPGMLAEVGIDPQLLAGLNNGAAIEFNADESPAFERFLHEMLEKLSGSDFLLAFPQHQTICTIHSHQQLWWTTAESSVMTGLERIFNELNGIG